MKILMIDKYHFIKGGAERYFFELKRVLERHGHEVIPFAMQHPDNFPSAWSDYFVSNIEYNGHTGLRRFAAAPKIFGRMLYSTEARARVERLVDRVRPDLVHLHMIDHQISPSILHVFQRHGIPVLQTCHQYKLVCPSYRLLVMRENRLCEKCVQGRFYHAVLERCHKDSLAASAMVAAESYLHRWMKIYDIIRLFHVPSRFLGEKLRQSGVAAQRVWHQFYTIEMADFPYSPECDDYFVYYGRLSAEKGILTLLRAMQHVKVSKLLIIGDGPQRPELEQFVVTHGLANVVFLGNRSARELVTLVGRAKFVVVPSEWYDNSPLVIYESFSMGKPVIATRLGGMPELIEDGVNGRLFDAKDHVTLTKLIQALLHDETGLKAMSRAARGTAEREFDPEVHYQRIHAVYQRLRN
ncbi:MAG: glycosyltransferase family 4 protein [candidate division KSB1 bacterium]|nr:glycosyltransferase family 4 protein [candidate division KSB1 bacterium]MDZ7275974.1 glycosyltransferase family 4 protein [candidate division KSB1 bacterium]MDZ7285744.1 glycosyltransferase family 4 protein [candidate division KSB1 bacterium]MDZ7298776.1 glycosyltransferase family 4 protein [candidate division KSB1 bacterium]MDZ7305959.1 glycosyltransferase family 4 protein [candidate division KSB1 bacterium]